MPNITNTITIHPGENFTLPPGATIISVSDSTNLESSCADIKPTTLQAWNFNWELYCTDGNPNNYLYQFLKELQFTTVNFDLDEVAINEFINIKNKINTKGVGIITAVICQNDDCNGGHTQVCLNILAPADLGQPYLFIKDYDDGSSNFHSLYIKGQKITDASTPIFYTA